jgi:hypothetical protein
VCLVAALWGVSGAAQSNTQFWPRAVGPFITVAWEPSPDPSVVGYIVYVGTESRGYTRAFDVGNRTSFVYPYAAANRRHFFAVAAYSSGRFAGGLSDEVSGFGRLVPPAGYVPDFNITPLGTGGAFSQCVAGVSCLQAATVSASDRRISALASSSEGQVWFVEDQQIFMIDVDGTVNRIKQPSGRRRSQVDGLAIDPRFGAAHYIYVEAIERLQDGSRELTISRYREVMQTLRDRAVIVSGIRLPATGNAPFTVDDSGRVFVAVPRDQSGPRPHNGVVFGVQADGTYVKRPSGSPMSWRGLSNPSGLVWDPEGRALWLSGANRAGIAMVERLPMTSLTDVPRVPTTDARRYLLVAGPGGRLLRIDRRAAGAEPVLLGGSENVTAVTGAGRDVVFAATHSIASGSRIVAIPMAD